MTGQRHPLGFGRVTTARCCVVYWCESSRHGPIEELEVAACEPGDGVKSLAQTSFTLIIKIIIKKNTSSTALFPCLGFNEETVTSWLFSLPSGQHPIGPNWFQL